MNMLERIIPDLKAKVSVEAGLLHLMFMLRGGRAQMDDAIKDCCQWEIQFGEPTWEKVETWAESQTMEADIVEKQLQIMLKNKGAY